MASLHRADTPLQTHPLAIVAVATVAANAGAALTEVLLWAGSLFGAIESGLAT